MAEEIYQEKYASVASVNVDESVAEDFADIAYQNMMERETYIAELISLYSGTETNTTEWEYNLNYLKTHYNEITSMEEVNTTQGRILFGHIFINFRPNGIIQIFRLARKRMSSQHHCH